MHWIILFVGLLINIDIGDCAIRARGDYKTEEIFIRHIHILTDPVQAPGVSGAAGRCVTPPWTRGVAGGGGAGSGGRTQVTPWSGGRTPSSGTP